MEGDTVLYLEPEGAVLPDGVITGVICHVIEVKSNLQRLPFLKHVSLIIVYLYNCILHFRHNEFPD
jgi:hypothetical protein